MIVNSGRYNPAANNIFFNNTKTKSCWSSTTNVESNDEAWTVYFYYGQVYYGSDKFETYYARAVRGGRPEIPGKFSDNEDGTVTDAETGLMWLQTTSGPFSWEDALNYCENGAWANYEDWRLPNRNELQSLVDYSVSNPSIDTDYFPDTEASRYWSSTPYEGIRSPALSCFVLFRRGALDYNRRST
ncbi:MAG: DUF1566 domain-containing protein, partial [bacterium]|nr:DUF1566 domain-containing protein [bacterium]